MATSPNIIALEDIHIANPCRANWNRMKGDEQSRFCKTCSKNVYNLSGMTRAEAEAFVSQAEGEICVRLYKRADGTVITSDCPVGMSTNHAARFSYGLLMMLVAPLLAVGGAFGAQHLKSDIVMYNLRNNALVSFVTRLFEPRQTVFGTFNNALVTSSYEVPEESVNPWSRSTLSSNQEIES